MRALVKRKNLMTRTRPSSTPFRVRLWTSNKEGKSDSTDKNSGSLTLVPSDRRQQTTAPFKAGVEAEDAAG